MKDLVQRILQIDQTAKTKLDQANHKRQETLAIIETKKQELTASLAQSSADCLLKAEQCEAESTQEAIDQIQQTVEQEKQRLNTLFLANQTQYLNTLLSDIIPNH